MTSDAKNILIVIGSVRPIRIGARIAQWVLGIAQGTAGLSFELVDLIDWPLSFSGEPHLPAEGRYVLPLTCAWSRTIDAASGYIFVTPQYNWGYPASLKNALDHLYNEWAGKPAIIVSYAHRGGGRAALQLRQVLEGLHMRPTPTMPGIVTKADRPDAAGMLPLPDLAAYEEPLRSALLELKELLLS